MDDRDLYDVDNLTISSTTERLEVLQQFEWPEYLVFSAVLLSSVAIGVFYGCFQKQTSNEEYLLGGRKMHPIPVALSLLCSYVSSITLLGHPVEIYLFGTQLFMVLVCYIPLTLSLAYIFIPIYYNLQLTSVYEYLELRYNKYIRTILSIVNILYTIFYMSMVVYGPALALEFVTGIDHRILVAVIFIVCIFYSTVGGFKAVLWTDSLQAVIMFVSMAVVVILGITFIDGGLDTIWQRAKATDRIEFFNFDFDPRTRHTFWTAIIGGYFTWLPMYANQAQIQRYVSLPSMRSVKIALMINLVGLFILMGLCYLGGLVIFGTYYDCDPIRTGRIGAVDQLLPVFVMDTLGDYPGLPGLFVAGITCAGLSTVSSGVNALAASITEDYVKKFRPNLTDTQLAYVSKMTAFITGLLSFGFVFVAEQMGSIFSAATTLLGILGGPQLGIFTCGQFFPWVNTVGAVWGMVISFAWMGFLGIGSTIANNKGRLPVQTKSLLTTCLPNLPTAPPACSYWKDCEYSILTQIFSLSYLWYPALGCLTAMFFGVAFSLIFRAYRGADKFPKVKSKLIIPNILRFYVWIMPNEIHNLVDFSDDVITPLSTENSKGDIEKGGAGRPDYPLTIWRLKPDLISDEKTGKV